MDYARKEEILRATEEHVRTLQLSESSGHDWWHTYRVYKMASALGDIEGGDLFIICMAALLHDIADHKFHGGDTEIGPATACRWMESCGADEADIQHVASIIRDLSFKGAGVATPMKSLEGAIVQDADRLDAIGAIGIARAFAYGGHAGRSLYDPEKAPEAHDSFESYRDAKSGTIAHFYEKLLLLKDRMNTRTAKKIAAKRHDLMEQFLACFFKEWDARDINQ